MEANIRETNIEKCIHGSMRPCVCACPFNFDSDKFIQKIRLNNFNGAYREMANGLLFPAIVAECCERSCEKNCPEDLHMHELERAAVRYATRKEPYKFNVPENNGRIAIIGAGICGLACALKLAVRNFDVTVYEQNTEIGGRLDEIMSKDVYMAEFELQFKYAEYTLKSGVKVDSLKELSEYDAVLIAAGTAEPDYDFGLSAGWDEKSTATEVQGVFMAHGLAGGITAATTIEIYLKTGSMSGDAGTYITNTCNLANLHPNPLAKPVNREGEIYTKDEAKQEARRCVKCDCNACSDGCEFMKLYNLNAPDLVEKMQQPLFHFETLFKRESARKVYSCSACGHCGSVCNEGIDIASFALDIKQALFERGDFPSALHDYYMRDMADAAERDYFLYQPESEIKSRYMLFPGCQETGYAPEHVKAVYTYLSSLYSDTSVLLGCCGVPAMWAGNAAKHNEVLKQIHSDWERVGKPTIVTMCATCQNILSERFEDAEFISIYEIISKLGLPSSSVSGGAENRIEAADAVAGEDAAVFDPCSSREFPEMQQAVRRLASLKGVSLTELPDFGETARCCGQSGHIMPANEELYERMVKRSANMSELPYIVYCASCRNLFLNEGKECRHILDDVFGLKPIKKPCHISDMKTNRSKLKLYFMSEMTQMGTDFNMREQEIGKTNLISECHSIESADYPDNKDSCAGGMPIMFEESVLEKMDHLLISQEEITQVIEHCEESATIQTGSKYIGYRQIGIITYWAEYEKSDIIKVVNAYSHRMSVAD